MDLGKSIRSGLLHGFQFEELGFATVEGARLEGTWNLVGAVVTGSAVDEGEVALWIAPDSVATFASDESSAPDVALWEEAPWQYPAATYLYSANDVARETSVWQKPPSAMDLDAEDFSASCLSG